MFPEWIYTIDILFAVFVIFFVIRGTRHGLSGELAHAATLFALLIGLCFFYPQLAQWVSDSWQALPPEGVRIVVLLLLVLMSALIFLLMRLLFKRLLKDKLGESADKIAGGVAGAVRGTVVGLALFAGLSLIPSAEPCQTLSGKSAIGGWVCSTLTPWLEPRILKLPVLKDKVSDRIEDLTQ